MYPWLWFWAPQVHFPWSGAVSQNIEPRTSWFSEHIPDDAGNADIEARATQLASYGKQLGLLTEALLGIAEKSMPGSAKAVEAIDRLRTLQSSIEAIKEQEYTRNADRVVAEVNAIRRRGGKRADFLAKALVTTQ